MLRPLNKSVVQRRTHLGQGRIQQRSWKNTSRRGKVSISQACDLFSIQKEGVSAGQHEIAESHDILGTQ